MVPISFILSLCLSDFRVWLLLLTIYYSHCVHRTGRKQTRKMHLYTLAVYTLTLLFAVGIIIEKSPLVLIFTELPCGATIKIVQSSYTSEAFNLFDIYRICIILFQPYIYVKTSHLELVFDAFKASLWHCNVLKLFSLLR